VLLVATWGASILQRGRDEQQVVDDGTVVGCGHAQVEDIGGRRIVCSLSMRPRTRR
jgi:hypothetical protein